MEQGCWFSLKASITFSQAPCWRHYNLCIYMFSKSNITSLKCVILFYESNKIHKWVEAMNTKGSGCEKAWECAMTSSLFTPAGCREEGELCIIKSHWWVLCLGGSDDRFKDHRSIKPLWWNVPWCMLCVY